MDFQNWVLDGSGRFAVAVSFRSQLPGCTVTVTPTCKSGRWRGEVIRHGHDTAEDRAETSVDPCAFLKHGTTSKGKS